MSRLRWNENRALVRLAWRKSRANWVGAASLVALCAVSTGTGVVAVLALGGVALWPVMAPIAAILIAAVAGSTLAISIKRSAVTYGQLRAIGARQSHIRDLVVLEAAVPAAIGVGLGFVGGVVVAFVLGPQLPELDIPSGLMRRWEWVAAFLMPGVAAAVGVAAAAVAPAKRAAGTDVRGAMSGRAQPESQVSFGANLVWRSLAVTLGFLFLAGGFGTGSFTLYVLLVFVAFVVVALAMRPVLVAIAGQADRVPMFARFAVRDVGRNRARAQWGVAASLALSTLAVMAASGIESDRGVYDPMDARLVLVGTGGFDEFGNRLIVPTDEDQHEALVSAVAAEVDATSTAEVEFLYSTLVLTPANDGWGTGLQAAILTPELARVLDLPLDAVEAAAQGSVLIGNRGYLASCLHSEPIVSGSTGDLPFQVAPFGGSSSGPQFPEALVSPALARRLDQGWDRNASVGDGRLAVVAAPGPLSGDQRGAVLALGDKGQGTVSVSHSRNLWGLSTDEFMALVLGLFAVTAVVLARVFAGATGREMEQQISALVAMGSRPSVRRLGLAAQTLVQTLLGGVAGTLLGLLLFRVVTSTDSSVNHPILPWLTMLVMVVGVPLAAMALVALATASGRPSVSRHLGGDHLVQGA